MRKILFFLIISLFPICNSCKAQNVSIPECLKQNDKPVLIALCNILQFLNNQNELNGSFKHTIQAAKQYPWMLEAFKDSIESKLSNKINAKDVISWFKITKPNSYESKVILYDAEIRFHEHSSVNTKKAIDVIAIKKALATNWVEANLSKQYDDYLIQRYKFSTETINKKINYLIWNNKLDSVSNFIPFLNKKDKEDVQFKLKLAKYENGYSLYRKIGNNELETFLYIRFLIKIGDTSKVAKQLLKINPKQQYINKWWRIANINIRDLMDKKHYDRAFTLSCYYQRILASKGLNAESIDASWLAGFIAANFLNKTKDAILHLTKVHNTTKSNPLKAQAAYWLSMTYKRINKVKSAEWLNIARKYNFTFYGYIAQITSNNILNIKDFYNKPFSKFATDNKAQEGLRAQNQSVFNIRENLSTKSIKQSTARVEFQRISNNGNKGNVSLKQDILDLIFCVKLLYNSSYKHYANRIIKNLYTLPINESNAITKQLIKDNMLQFAVMLSMEREKNGDPILLETYSLNNLNVPKTRKNNISLYYGIIRQESMFDINAISSAGAIGLMQIMPSTGESLCKKLGLTKGSYSSEKNVEVGVYYIDELYEKFNNIVLALAAYNGGSDNVNKWITKYSLNNKQSIKEILSFIETIPFKETRLYVKKVITNIWTYELLNKTQINKNELLKYLISSNNK